MSQTLTSPMPAARAPLSGAIFMILADILSRVLIPQQILPHSTARPRILRCAAIRHAQIIRCRRPFGRLHSSRQDSHHRRKSQSQHVRHPLKPSDGFADPLTITTESGTILNRGAELVIDGMKCSSSHSPISAPLKTLNFR